MNILTDLHNVIKGACFVDEPLSRHTSFNIGGHVGLFVEPSDKRELQNVLKEIADNDLNWTVIGNGTNILAGELGLPDVVIKLVDFNNIELIGNKVNPAPSNPANGEIGSVIPSSYPCSKLGGLRRRGGIKAGSGLNLSKLTGFAIEHALSGIEFLAGIPGTVGGAVSGNAGAQGKCIADIITEISVMNKNGEVYNIKREDIKFSYRKLDIGDDIIILDATLNLLPGDKQDIQNLVRDYLGKRKKNIPKEPSAGCIFKNPADISAGELIDKTGLKGFSIGKAMISNTHANIIVNLGGASSADVFSLIKYIQEEVYRKRGIKLEKEIVCWGAG